MSPFARSLVLLAAGLVVTACDRPESTVTRLRTGIAAYKAAPTDAMQLEIEAELAQLDQQIAELERRGKVAEAAGFRSSADNLRADYRAARIVRSLNDAKSAIRGVGEAVKEAGQSIGEVFKKDESAP